MEDGQVDMAGRASWNEIKFGTDAFPSVLRFLEESW